MEKKYYDLIITLIKQHKKFAEYEAILEDIANDVYEHSKVVLDSVTNEEVITAYLAKVISTSMITVPKKLNFNTKARHRVISATISETTGCQETNTHVLEKNEVANIVSIEKQEPVIPIQDNLTLEDDELLDEVSVDSVDSVEKCFNEIEEFPEISNDSDYQEVDNIEVDLEEKNRQLISEEENELVLPSESDIENINDLEESNNDNEEEVVVEEISANNVPDVDKNLVDRMINGVPEVETETIETEPSENEEKLSLDTEVEDILGSIELQEDNIPNNTTEENTPDGGIIVESEDFIEPLISQDEILQEVPEEDNSIESIEDLNIESVDVSQEIEDSVSLDLENNTPEFEIEEIAEIDHLESFDTENSIGFEEDSNETYILESDDDAATIESISENFSAPCYDNFYFEPQKEDFDEEEILSYLEDINEKHPEKRILEICELKFKQKLSVAEIVEKTGFTLDEVLSILNEIVDTVKD